MVVGAFLVLAALVLFAAVAVGVDPRTVALGALVLGATVLRVVLRVHLRSRP